MRAISLRSLAVCTLSALTFTTGASAPAQAQQPIPLGVRATDNALAVLPRRADTLRLHSEDTGKPAYAMPVRAALGVGGAFLGAYGGALAASAVLPHSHGDDPGLAEALEGAAVGSVVMSALLAAAPHFSSSCGPLRRFGYGVGGAVAGALLGSVLSASQRGGGAILGFIAGEGVGAGVVSGLC